MKPRILVVIPTLKDHVFDTVNSVRNQTVKVSKIIIVCGDIDYFVILKYFGYNCVYVKPNMSFFLGKRIAISLNKILSQIDLKRYDYILRLDADVILPKDFIEKNLKINADYIGKAGYAMLIKTSSFLKVFNGKFIEVNAEDSYVGLMFLYKNYKVKNWVCLPKLIRKSGKNHNYKYYFVRGIEMFKLGYEPIHVLETIKYDFRNIFCFLAYFSALLKRTEQYIFASWVFIIQIRRIIYGKTI